MSKELLTFLKCCNPTLLLSAGLTLGFKASLFVERADPNACIQLSKYDGTYVVIVSSSLSRVPHHQSYVQNQ